MPQPPRRITLRDIARRAGVHFTTVSLALRNHPRLPATTRERVQAVARELGYVPDPMLSSLAHYRSTLRPAGYQATVAWVTNHPKRSGWREVRVFEQYFDGAAARAEELGFKLEEFWLRERGLTPQRATQILRARGIGGLILAPQPGPGVSLELEWDAFSAVAIGFSLARPSLHLVCLHQYRAIRLALRELLARGHRRPGLVLLRASDERVEQNWSAGFASGLAELAPRDRLAPLLLDRWDEGRFLRWVERHKPDVLLSKLLEVGPALQASGREAPRDLGVAYLTHASAEAGLSGISENPHAVGAAALDHLTGMLHRNERGVPALAHHLLIEGAWIEGATVRHRAESRR